MNRLFVSGSSANNLRSLQPTTKFLKLLQNLIQNLGLCGWTLWCHVTLTVLILSVKRARPAVTPPPH